MPDFNIENIDSYSYPELKEYADSLNITYRGNISATDLKEAIIKKLNGEDETPPVEDKGKTKVAYVKGAHTVGGLRIDKEITLTAEQEKDEYIMSRLRKAAARGEIKLVSEAHR